MKQVYVYSLPPPHFSSHSGPELAVRDIAHLQGVMGIGQRWPRELPVGRSLALPIEQSLTLSERAIGMASRLAQRTISRLARVPAYSTGGLALEVSALARMARTRGDIHHFLWGEYSCRVAPYADGWRGHRVIASFHQAPTQLRRTIRHGDYLRRLSAAVILGRCQAPVFERYLPPERVFFVPYCVDTEYFQPLSERPPRPRPVCTIIGGHLRDFSTLRAALDRLERRGVLLDFDVSARGPLLAFVEDLPRARIRLWAYEEELRTMYQEADVFVLPFSDVVASTTLLEALACGAPIATTDVGAIRDYVDDSCVALVPPRDAEALADAIERIVSDSDYARALRRNARARAENFSAKAAARRHSDLYARLLAQ